MIRLHSTFPAATTAPAAAAWTFGPNGLHGKHGRSEPELKGEDMEGVMGGEDGFFGAYVGASW